MSLLGDGAHLQQARLAGALSAPHATGTALVDPGRRRAVFAAAGLPPVAADRTYQLWVVTASGALPAGTFVPSADGTVAVAVSDLPAGEAIAGWAVSSEPGGGSERPSGPVLLSGTAGGR
jgi:anti-sigma-K factor RskA